MFGVQQCRTEILRAGEESSRSRVNVRGEQGAALPRAGRAPAAAETPAGTGSSSRDGPGLRWAASWAAASAPWNKRGAEWHFLTMRTLSRVCAVSLLRGSSRPISIKASASWSELVMDCFKQEVGLDTFWGPLQAALPRDSTSPWSSFLA